MLIDFEEERHIYTVDGDFASVSVTELLSKQGISPAYAKTAVVKAAAERGKQVHRDMELIVKQDGYLPLSAQGVNFYKWYVENVKWARAEQMVGYSRNGLIVAGTCDIYGELKDGRRFLADHKNTAKFHRDAVTWQVNILDYFFRALKKGEGVNGEKLKYKKADVFYCFHYEPESGEMEIHELDRKDDAEIEELLEAEWKGEKYQRKELAVDESLKNDLILAETALYSIQLSEKEAKERAENLRAQLMAAMKEQGITSWKTDKFTASYVPSIERITVDSARLKKENPAIYSEYSKVTKVSECLHVKMKGEE